MRTTMMQKENSSRKSKRALTKTEDCKIPRVEPCSDVDVSARRLRPPQMLFGVRASQIRVCTASPDRKKIRDGHNCSSSPTTSTSSPVHDSSGLSILRVFPDTEHLVRAFGVFLCALGCLVQKDVEAETKLKNPTGLALLCSNTQACY